MSHSTVLVIGEDPEIQLVMSLPGDTLLSVYDVHI
jgi:hypothetical protein